MVEGTWSSSGSFITNLSENVTEFPHGGTLRTQINHEKERFLIVIHGEIRAAMLLMDKKRLPLLVKSLNMLINHGISRRVAQ